MSLAELHATYTSPLLNTGSIGRKSKKSALKFKKQLRSLARRTKSRLTAYARRQYFLTSAYSDLKIGAARNEDIVIMSVFSAVVLSFAALVTASEVFLNFFLTAFILSESISLNVLFVAAMAAAALAVVYGWFTAFVLNVSSISVMEGAANKQLRSVRSTFRKSLRHSSRVATAWMVLMLVIALPLAIAGILGIILLQFVTVSMEQLFIVIQAAIIISSAWVLLALMRYSLVANVALFEPSMPIMDCLSRSRQLVQRKGHVFCITWYLCLSAACASIYGVASLAENILAINKWLTFSMLVIPVILLFNGVMVVFYRKRRLARKY